MCFYHQVTRLQHPFLSENSSSFCQPSSTFQLTLHFTYCHFSSIFRPTTSYCGCPNFYSCTIHISENFGQTNTLNSLLFLAKLIWWQMQLTIQFICAATVIIFAYHQLPFLLEISIWIYIFFTWFGFLSSWNLTLFSSVFRWHLQLTGSICLCCNSHHFSPTTNCFLSSHNQRYHSSCLVRFLQQQNASVQLCFEQVRLGLYFLFLQLLVRPMPASICCNIVFSFLFGFCFCSVILHQVQQLLDSSLLTDSPSFLLLLSLFVRTVTVSL